MKFLLNAKIFTVVPVIPYIIHMHSHSTTRLEAARCEGQLCAYLSDTELQTHLSTSLLSMEGVTDWSLQQAKATALSTALSVAADRITELGLR